MFRLVRIFIFLSILFAASGSNAQSPKDTANQKIADLSKAYQKGALAEKAFLDTIKTSMMSFLMQGISFSNKELITSLAPYRSAIWDDKKNEDSKTDYYAIFANQAQMAGNLGQMRYYAEKINEVEQKKSNEPSLSALTIIADYYNTLWSYKNSRELYLAHKDFIKTLPEKAAKGKLNLKQMVQATIMLDKFGEALFELKDTIAGGTIEDLLTQIDSIAKLKYSDQHYELAHIEFAKLHVAICKGNGLSSGQIMRESIQQLERFIAGANTPDNLKEASVFSVTDNKIILFLDEKNVDSAAHYLKILTAMIGEEPGLYNRYMLQKYKSRLLYEQGLYQQSTDTLIDAMLASEDIRKDIVKDVNEMMYAQAKAEEQQLLLEEANQKKSNTERQLLIAGIVIAALIIAGIFLLQYNRRKQRNRFIDFKLNMARNIHDETGPALLYAQALAKANRTEQPTANKSELEKQIERTMEVIRHLSHDLKSDKLVTLFDLAQQTRATLDKLNPDNEFAYSITEDIDRKQFISHLQFTQIRALLNECITNSIKHADFKNISIALRQNGNKLTITYQDDGKGWETKPESNGIGIKNMEERVLQLNGTWKLDNSYPEGYSIKITVTLR